ncbi:MAG: outer membrane lipoprotein carrier protein LolA [Bacteroidales bacterium]|nr:outer membrane lipoprotein carrier protein LolA [Bacteroidales bacterium]
MKTLFIVAFNICFFILQAQIDDPKSKEILQKLSEKYKSYETMKFEFTFTISNPKNNVNESKNGSIYIKGDKYRLYLDNQIIICDGKTVWTYIKDENEVQINNVDTNNLNTPHKILTAYEKNYRSKFIKEAPMGNKIIQTIDLVPLKTQSFYKIRLEIDKTQGILYRSTIYDKNGSTFSYTITNFLENPKVFESRFTFNEKDYPGVIVNDMR